MPLTTWGMLAKSQTDPETIEEAIARIVAQHNNDAEAHLGAGQSLQSHKSAEIIDHEINSIIADKIKAQNVTLDKLDFDRFIFLTMFESLSPWFQTKTGGRGTILLSGASVQMYSGNHVNDVVSIQLTSAGITGNKNKDPYFAVTVLMPDIAGSNVDAWIVTDSAHVYSPFYGFGFWINHFNHHLYTVYGAGEAMYTFDTGFTDFSGFLSLKAFYDHSANVLYFYINNVLIHSEVSPDLDLGNDPMLTIGEQTFSASAGPEIDVFNAVYSRIF